MENLKIYLANNDHEKILNELPSPEGDLYKAVAAIQLGDYERALRYAGNTSFEKAYSYYKLKNFKKSLKILKKLSGEKVEILKAQCLYFLGHYSDAYELLQKYGNSDEVAVNLSAMEALTHINKVNLSKPSLFTSTDTNEIKNIKNYKFKSAECAMESEYNLLYKKIEDEREFVQSLRELDEKYNVEDSCIQKQLKNLLEEEISNLGKSDREIYRFNKGLENTIKYPVLYQKNFLDSLDSEYKIFKDYKTNKESYINLEKKFETPSQRLKLLKALILSHRIPSPVAKDKIIKLLPSLDESVEKQLIELLVQGIENEKVQKQAVELILSIKSN